MGHWPNMYIIVDEVLFPLSGEKRKYLSLAYSGIDIDMIEKGLTLLNFFL